MAIDRESLVNAKFSAFDAPTAREASFNAKFFRQSSGPFQASLKSLVGSGTTQSQRTLAQQTSRGVLVTPVSVARPSGTLGAGGSGAIASPLTEPDSGTRTHHPPVTITSTDGLFVLEIEPLKDIDLKDAKDQDVRITYDAPA